MQQLAHDRTLPGSIEIKANLARSQDFLHAHRNGGARNAIDVAARRSDRVNRSRLPAERDNARGQAGEGFIVDRLAGFRRIVESEMTGDTDTAEGDIDAAAAFDQAVGRL